MTSGLVVPIAGMSSRFRTVTNLPKWSLLVGGSSILERAINSVVAEHKFDRTLIVALESHREILVATLARFRHVAEFETVYLPAPENGQASSVGEGLRLAGWPSDTPLTIWNGDTALGHGWSEGLDFSGNFLLGSNLAGDHWSFIESVDGIVKRTEEKNRISNIASLGLYCFSEAGLFLEALSASRQTTEHFVAPLYNYLIGVGEVVRCSTIEPSFFVPLGTPDEVRCSCKKFGWDLPF